MTMSETMLARLEGRGLDVELAVRLGLDSVFRDGGEALAVPFIREGRVVRRKYRQFDREPKWVQDKGGVRCAWNEDCLRDDSLIKLPLVITEGELDGASAIQAGFLRTISVPDGAPMEPGDTEALAEGKKYEWLREIMPLLRKDRVGEIILAVDGDGPGAALMQDLAAMLGKARCKFVTYPKAADSVARGRDRLKDLNEVLQDYGARGVATVVERAQWLKANGVYKLSELAPLPPMRIYDIGFEAFGAHMKLRLGDFIVVTGIPGMGKTTFVQDMLCRVADKHALRIAWASFEQTPQRDHKRAFREWIAEKPEREMSPDEKVNADAWIDARHAFIVPDEDDEVGLDWMLEKMELAVVRHECSVIVIDPWNEMDHAWDGRAETETQYTGRAIKTFKRFAKAFQVVVIVVAHPTKQAKKEDGTFAVPTLYDINGSAHWFNKPDLGIVVHRIGPADSLLKTAKSRYHDLIGKPGEVVAQYCASDRRFRETERMMGSL